MAENGQIFIPDENKTWKEKPIVEAKANVQIAKNVYSGGSPENLEDAEIAEDLQLGPEVEEEQSDDADEGQFDEEDFL